MISLLLLQLSKVGVTIATVLGLAWIAERVSTRVAGVLAGFPLGSAIALVYIGVEQGADFAAQSASHALLGFISAQAMTTAYWLGLRTRQHRFIAPSLAVAAFSASNLLLLNLQTGLLVNLLLSVFCTLVFAFAYRMLPQPNITNARRLTPLAILMRALISAACIVLITLLAYVSSSAVAGLFAAFPITFFPLLLILHLNYGKAPVTTLIRFYPLGLGALITHCLIASLTYADWGLTAGTLAGLAGATAYLVLLQQLRQHRRRFRSES